MDLKNIKFGALTRTRTANLLITNQLLYQLSYEGLIAVLNKSLIYIKIFLLPYSHNEKLLMHYLIYLDSQLFYQYLF